MGCISSTSRTPTPSTSDIEFNPDLTLYQDACRTDPVLQSFDSTLQARTNRVISILAVVPSLSLHSLSVVIIYYLETSIQTLDFFKSIEDCLKHAKSSVSFLQTAINEYHEDDANHLNTLEQLNKFKASENLFSNELFASLWTIN
ncbi:UPF0496 protein-like protein [Tanacetum coccineum]